jgi:hypothetical protein
MLHFHKLSEKIDHLFEFRMVNCLHIEKYPLKGVMQPSLVNYRIFHMQFTPPAVKCPVQILQVGAKKVPLRKAGRKFTNPLPNKYI